MMYFMGYDIADPKRLRNVAKTLESFGLRVQYSFFQCDMPCKVMEDLRDKLLTMININEDNLRIYPVCDDCLGKTAKLGKGNIFESKTYQIL